MASRLTALATATAPSFMPTKPTTAKPAPLDAASASIRAARGPAPSTITRRLNRSPPSRSRARMRMIVIAIRPNHIA